MIPGQITVPPPAPPAPVRYECAECGGIVARLDDGTLLPRPCGHTGRVLAQVAAVIALPLNAHGG